MKFEKFEFNPNDKECALNKFGAYGLQNGGKVSEKMPCETLKHNFSKSYSIYFSFKLNSSPTSKMDILSFKKEGKVWKNWVFAVYAGKGNTVSFDFTYKNGG